MPRIPGRQKATVKLQIYVTPYMHERLKKLAKRRGLKGVSVLARLIFEEHMGLDKDHRAAIVKHDREEVPAPPPTKDLNTLADRVQEIMRETGLAEGAARVVAKAERKR